LVGCYDYLKSFDYYLRDFTVYPEITGGNLKYARTNNQIQFLSYNFTNDVLNNDMKSFYSTAYKTIYAANNILQYVGTIADATDYQKTK